MAVSGTTPEGAISESDAARRVRRMFERVAGRYDLANHLLSANVDRYWRARTVSRVRDILRRRDTRILDLACGTGDLLMALEREAGRGLMGSDFCRPMLEGARQKLHRAQLRSTLFEGDALALPVADGVFDLVTIAFGFRNFANYFSALRELRRVLRPHGALAILEFTQPSNPLFASAYKWYSQRILPRVGGLISGAPDAYRYLPDSVSRFPGAPQLAAWLRDAGFDVEWEYLSFGIAALHIGRVHAAGQ